MLSTSGTDFRPSTTHVVYHKTCAAHQLTKDSALVAGGMQVLNGESPI